MLENVPHVPATFNGNEAIFLLDTGAGGVDLIFHGRAVDRYNLTNTLELAGTASVKGINTSGKGLQVLYVRFIGRRKIIAVVSCLSL